MIRRRGLGAGRGKGWKNIQNYDSARHSLASRGIKTVSLPQRRRRAIKQEMLPLLKSKVISGYNITDRPLGMKSHVMFIYGHDVRAHGDAILSMLKRGKVKYQVVPRESQFLDDEYFVKSAGQTRRANIVTAKEYEIWLDASPSVIHTITDYIGRHAVNRNNPENDLPYSYTTPDVRLKNELRYRNFRAVDEVRKPLDRNTDLVILSVRKRDTAILRKKLHGERVSKVLIQNYKPRKHSLYAYIRDKTQ